MAWILLSLMTLALAASPAQSADLRRPKKLIATGWDQADSDRLPGLVAEIDKRPFDGIVVEALGRNDEGKPVKLGWAFHSEKWKQAWFEAAAQRLKACKFRRPMDNFVLFYANPGNVDWFDDAGWREVVEHWRIAARVAREAGFKGILFDPEPYAEPHAQFSYRAQPQHARHTFGEYCQKARQRGREVMKAVAGEYPDLTVLCYFLNSVNAQAVGQVDAERALTPSGYGLLPAMLDGWLDVAPPTLTLVDGCESAYHYNSPLEFLEAGNLMRGACQDLVAPENRAKYRAQVQTSFGLYLDAYANPKSSPWYIDGQGGSRAERLRANAADALRVADEYVWVYGEKHRWWPTSNGAVGKQSWPEVLPDCDRLLSLARDPDAYGRDEVGRMKAEGKAVNLARNGDFAAETAAGYEGSPQNYREGGPPAGWGTWQDDKSKGTFTWDRQAGLSPKGTARMAGVAQGCFLQAYPAKSGERFAVSAACRSEGKGDASIRVRWQTADGAWTREGQDRVLYPSDRVAGSEWSKCFGVVEVPQGVGRLVILLGTSGQATASDLVWFDDVELVRLP
jgi:hypothetical protein